MNNPYQYLEKYTEQEISYQEFCELTKVEPLKDMQKNRQIKGFCSYMDVQSKYGKVIINKLYNQDEMLIVQKNSKFTEYFENMLIVLLNECEGNVASFTYSEIQKAFWMVNDNYIKNKYNRQAYADSINIKMGSMLDFDKYEEKYEKRHNIDLFFNVSTRLMKQIINNALKSMKDRSLITYTEWFKLYKETYVPEIKDFRMIGTICNDEQVGEILDIKKEALDKFKIKTNQDAIFLEKETRDKYYAFINNAIKNSESLNHSDYFGKMFIVNIGKEGIKIEANKIDMTSSKQLFNTNIQKKFLTGKELQCVNNLLKQRMVDDMIQK